MSFKIGYPKLVQALRAVAIFAPCDAHTFGMAMWPHAAGWALKSKTGQTGARMHSAAGGMLGRIAGMHLIVRQGRGWSPTPQGAEFLRQAVRTAEAEINAPGVQRSSGSQATGVVQPGHVPPPQGPQSPQNGQSYIPAACSSQPQPNGSWPPGPSLNALGARTFPVCANGYQWTGWFWDGSTCWYFDGSRRWWWDNFKWQLSPS